MNGFRDAITDAVANAEAIDPDTQQTFPADAEDIADVILAMPEMQAICTFIIDAIPDDLAPMTDETMAAWMRRQHLPESVIEWVLS